MSLRRTSLISHWHEKYGAEIAAEGNCAGMVRRYTKSDANSASGMSLCDLSLLPRTGFKGAGTSEWLSRHIQLPEIPNQYLETAHGELIMRLGQNEFLISNGLTSNSCLTQTLAKLHCEEAPKNAWQLPRQDSHCFFVLSGEQAIELLSTLCAIDFNEPAYAQGRIAQTSIARINGIVCRRQAHGIESFCVLADISMTEYLWVLLMESGRSFHLQPCGLDGLLQQKESTNPNRD